MASYRQTIEVTCEDSTEYASKLDLLNSYTPGGEDPVLTSVVEDEANLKLTYVIEPG